MGIEIGTKQAEIFYKMSISAVQEVMSSVHKQSKSEIVPYWAVAERQSVDDDFWRSFKTIWTGEGGLGERIFNIFDALFEQYKNVIIIGSDSPQINSKYILDAASKLDKGIEDGIIGPCKDGGFVLFGSKSEITKSIWTDIEYSTDNTLLQLTKKLDENGFNYSYLSKLSDVDNYNDLEKLYYVLLMNRKYNLPAQNRLMMWIESIIK